MKKLVLFLCLVGGVFMLSSCDKTCTCKSYRNGVLTGEVVGDLPEGVSSCSDMDVSAETENGVVRETKCS